MLKSEWNDNSSTVQELTVDDTFCVSGGYTGDAPPTDPVYLAWLDRAIHGLPAPTPTPAPVPVVIHRDRDDDRGRGHHRY